MVDRRLEKILLPLCENHDITIQAYSPLEQGLFTGKIGMDYVVKPGEVRDNRKWWVPENRKLVLEMLAGWSDLCQKYESTLGNLAIGWTIARSENINVLSGARKMEQVSENVKAGNIMLEKSDMQRMTDDADRIIEISK